MEIPRLRSSADINWNVFGWQQIKTRARARHSVIPQHYNRILGVCSFRIFFAIPHFGTLLNLMNSLARPSIAIPPVQYPVYTGYPYAQTWPHHTGLSALPQAQPQCDFQLGVPPNVGPAAYLPFDPNAYYYSNPSASPNSTVDELTTPLDEFRVVINPPHNPPYPVFASASNLGHYPPPNAPLSNYHVDRFGYPASKPLARNNQKRSVSAPLSRKRIASFKSMSILRE